MTEREIRDIFDRAGAIKTNGHFVYANGPDGGDHGDTYISKEEIFPRTEDMKKLCTELWCISASEGIDTIIGPVKGGAFIAQMMASCCNSTFCSSLNWIYADKDGTKDASGHDNFVIRDDYAVKYLANRRVLVAEDVLNTGTTARKVVELVRAYGGYVVGVAAFCNRGGVTTAKLGDVPNLHVLLDIELKKYPALLCPICREGRVPINTEFGKGAAFLAAKEAARKSAGG